eukprot:Opistho-2@68852
MTHNSTMLRSPPLCYVQRALCPNAKLSKLRLSNSSCAATLASSKRLCKIWFQRARCCFLVSHAVEQLQSHLVRALYREETFVPLMRENEAITERRAQAVRLVDMLRRADAIVAEAMDSAGIGAGDGAAARPSSGPYTPAR